MKYNRCNPTWIQRKITYPIWRLWARFVSSIIWRFRLIRTIKKFIYTIKILVHETDKATESINKFNKALSDYRGKFPEMQDKFKQQNHEI